ncbi:MAG: FtsW/RodA/SpoVE family cell cycle protein, partial [Gammaproteobacteria bacterium]|nr:FtsW/RodA/SpoVE family cell cycle protein [Gammaproteobacteria bacterium]
MAEIAAHMVHRRLPPLDRILLYDVVLLLGIGLVMVYSASAFVAAHREGYSAYYFVHDCVNIIVSLITLSLVVQIPMSAWQRLSPYLLLAGMGALVLVLIPHIGVRVNGSARWLTLGVGHIQPSEFFKLLLVLYLAGYLVRRRDRLSEFTHGIMTVAVLLMVTGVLL